MFDAHRLMRFPTATLTCVLLLLWTISPATRLAVAADPGGYQPTDGDSIAIVGNALGERLQFHPHFEAMLRASFPDASIRVRNLCVPGDEIFHRVRSQNFGAPEDHLSHSGANVVVHMFGYNESFADQPGRYAKQLEKLVTETQAADFGGGKVRCVLVSPIAFESTGDPNLPDGKAHNRRLKAYTEATAKVARATGAMFADVFTPTAELFEKTDARLTLNGCHLNDAGYEAFAPILVSAITGKSAGDVSQPLLDAIGDKDFHWFNRYRAVNGYSIYGARGLAGNDGTYNNRDVMERERAILDQMTDLRDERIDVIIAKGDAPPVDDSKTLPFIETKTNVGGPNDKNAKAGKLGSLEYLSSDEQLKLFEVHPDFEVQLFASEEDFPELANPVTMDFDNAGRLMVSVMPSYPHWKPKTAMDDKILMFPDADGDGKADRCVVFADGLHQPTSMECSADGVYIGGQHDLIFARDTDGDDYADEQTRVLFGFDTADSHHGLAAFEFGPAGRLYMQEGTFKFSQIETPYGLVRLGEGGIFSFHPKTFHTDVFVNFAFANPWGHVFDRFGQSFVADASPGNSYWTTPISGRLDYPLKHPGGSQHRRVAKLGGGDPKYRHPTFYPKRTRPSAGAELVSGDHFPPEWKNRFLLTNVIGDRSVLVHDVNDEGSGFGGVEVKPLVSCRDGNFRPVDLEFAPDGSLYVVDWHNALIGHLQHNLRDPSRDHSHGRIWRITHKSRPLQTPTNVAGEPIDALVNLLTDDDDRLVYRARRELADRDTDDVIAAIDGLSDAGEQMTLESLWMAETHNRFDADRLQRCLSANDFRIRAAAVKVLADRYVDVDDAAAKLQTLINDDHPRVRIEAVRALSFTPGDDAQRIDSAIETALSVLRHPCDDMTKYTLEETLRRLEQLKGDLPEPTAETVTRR